VWLDDLIMRRHRTINDLARCVSDIIFPPSFLLHSSNVGASQPFPRSPPIHFDGCYSSETFAIGSINSATVYRMEAAAMFVCLLK
jgi:hypothetical protein